MGNAFGNYPTREKATEALHDRGFSLVAGTGFGEYFRKPSAPNVRQIGEE